jgi:hypothetical protein
MTPIHCYIGEALETHLPTRVKKEKSSKADKTKDEEVFSITNVLIKLIVSETVIGAITNSMVVIFFALLEGDAISTLSSSVQKRVPEMMSDSRKFWPMVTLCRFVIVPPKHHGVFNNTMGFLWSIYCALTMS